MEHLELEVADAGPEIQLGHIGGTITITGLRAGTHRIELSAPEDGECVVKVDGEMRPTTNRVVDFG
jgi:hypothetical protein